MSFIRGTPTSWSWGDLVVGDIPDLSGTYQVVSEKNAVNGYCGLDASGLVLDSDIPASICRDSELTTHVDAVAPHANATSIGGKSFGSESGDLFVLPTGAQNEVCVFDHVTEIWKADLLSDAQIPAAIARDAEVPNLASASVVTGADLPAASAAYVGILKIHRVTGENKSSIYICVQNDEAIPAYEWVMIGIST